MLYVVDQYLNISLSTTTQLVLLFVSCSQPRNCGQRHCVSIHKLKIETVRFN